MSDRTIEEWLDQKYGLTPVEVHLRSHVIGDNVEQFFLDQNENDLMKALKDDQVAVGIAETKEQLKKMSEMITLDTFPFQEMPVASIKFTIQALQMEIATAIRSSNHIEIDTSILLAVDSELRSILQKLFTDKQ